MRAVEAISRRASYAPVSPVRRLLLRLVGRPSLTPVRAAEAALSTVELSEGSVSTRSAPCAVGDNPQVVREAFAPLRAHVVANAIVSAYASGVVSNGSLILPDALLAHRETWRTDGDGLFAFENDRCVGRRVSPQGIPQGILIGGGGAFNWYHFMIEELPKLFLAASLPPETAAWPLLVPEECRRFPSFADALAVFAGGRPIRYLKRGEYLQADQLVLIDDVSLCPYNLSPGVWPRPDDFGQHDTVLRAFLGELRQTVLERATANANTPRRIFLVRPVTRRQYNQDELVEIARAYGFEPQSPETLSLAEQARLFDGAEMVVGASGAAWVGMAFRADTAKYLSWLPAEYMGFSCYSNLAALLGHHMAYLKAIPDLPISNTEDAYRASYWIDPAAFDQALRHLTEESPT